MAVENRCLTSLLFLICLIQSAVSVEECQEDEKVCVVNGTVVMYNCNEICCGGGIYDKSYDSACCGDEDFGEVYSSYEQLCCSPTYSTEFAVYNKTNEGGQCCGVDLITPSMRNEHSCCQRWKGAALFNFYTDMCCNGYVTAMGNTGFGQCCGNVGYDRRNGSCPCNEPPVATVVHGAECCRSRDNSAMMPMIRNNNEACCNGETYNTETHFCCDSVVGDPEFHTCCDNELVAKDPENSGTSTGCCTLNDGSKVQYDVFVSFCCNGMVDDKPYGEEAMCCGDTSFLSPSQGDSCCVDVNGVGNAFFANETVCCNGTVSRGDSCCGGIAYEMSEEICCGENLIETGDDKFVEPSCCMNEAFDSYTQTCCGQVVHENPLVYDEVEGSWNSTSHTTRCCGSHDRPETLQPFDYQSSMCCGGLILQSGKNLSCCGSGSFNTATQFCCDEIAYDVADFLNLYDASQQHCSDFLVLLEENEQSGVSTETSTDASVVDDVEANTAPATAKVTVTD